MTALMEAPTLYISDLDGTLLGTDSRISPRSNELINDLTDRGVLVTVATARTPATVVPLMAQTRTLPPAIVMTGAALWDRRADRFTDAHFLPAADVSAALRLCEAEGVNPFVYLMADDGRTLDVYHAARTLNRAERSFYEERMNLTLKRFHLGTPAPPRALEAGILFYAMGDAESICRAAEALRTHTGSEICCYPDIFNPEVYNLEMFPPGVTKAAAVLRLKERLGAGRMVVFGDSLNDLPMLAVADVAVAVGNALPEVKAAADVVIEPNYTDSVARFIASDANRRG